MFNKKSISYIGIYLILFNLLSGILFLDITNALKLSNSNNKVKNIVKKNYSEDRVIIKFKDNSGIQTISDMQNTIQGIGLSSMNFFNKVGVGIVGFNKKTQNIDNVIKKLSELSNVKYVEYDYKREISYTGVVTNDTKSIEQWYLKSIQVDEAWEIYDDNENKIIVSVNDTGLDYDHYDLIGNLKDLSSNCISDTGSIISGGCPNYGWNFEGSGSYNLVTAILAENDIYDINGHGTHVAGIIGAVGNNGTGVIGVTQNAAIIGARIETYENDYATFYVSNTIRALNFAIENGAKVVNASYGGTSYSSGEYDAINIAKTNGILFVAAAGNNANNNDGGTHFYPSDYDLDNIISVASIGEDDTLAYYSNYGITSVDIVAPGGDLTKDSGILSIYPYYETIWNHDMNSFSGITLSGTGLEWNIVQGLAIETQSGSYDWVTTYTGSEDKTLTFDNTFNLSGAKFAKFDGYFECELQPGDDLEILINNQVIGTAYPYWTYSRAITYGNVILPIPSNLYTSGLELKVRFFSDSDTNVNYGCTLDNFSIIKYDDTKHNYNSLQGTSMAAPVVTGIASMIWSYKPELTYLEVKDIIFSSLDILSDLSTQVLTSGKLNAKNAIKELIYRYSITKNGTFEGETFNTPSIILDGKDISLSGSIINITGLGTVISLSGSTIMGTGTINVGTGNSINDFNTSSDFDIVMKNTSGVIINNSETVYGESLIMSLIGTLTGSTVNLKLTTGIGELYNNLFSDNGVFLVSNSFSGSIEAYIYKNGYISEGINTGVVLEILNKTILTNIDFQYTPSIFTGTLDFNNSSITNNTGVYINLTSTHYPVDYTISGDVIGTYTGTLNNSGSILIELTSGDGIKTLSGVLKNLNNQYSQSFTGSIELDQTAPIVSLSANTSSGIAAQSIEFTVSSSDLDYDSESILWSNNLNGDTSTGLTYTVLGETSTGLIVTVNASDILGNSGDTLSEVYIIDNTGPEAPTNIIFNDGITINFSNVDSLKLTGSGKISESGSLINYIFTDSLTGSINGTGVLNNDSFNISGINLSSLSDGNIDYSISLTDILGNIGLSATGVSFKETVPPTGSLQIGEYVNSTGTTIYLESSEYPVNYEITGDIISTVTGSLSNSGTVNIELTSSEGLKNISVIFTDSGDNNSPSYTGSTTIDQINPTINILSHSDNENVVSSIITLTGTIFDINTIDLLEINGLSVAINSGNFIQDIELVGGNNLINYIGTDIAGNITSGSINIVRNIFNYDVETFTGNLKNTGSVLFIGSGATSSGVIFNSTGTLDLSSSDGNNSVLLSLSGLTIDSNGWDLVFNPPEQVTFSGSFSNTGYTHLESLSYNIGNSDVELVLTGSLAEVTIYVGDIYNGQSLGIFRSTNNGLGYNYLVNCLVSSGVCTFSTDKFSLYTIATPSDSTPDSFSFTDITNSELSAEHISSTITVSGINTGSIISISNGTYSINDGSFTGAINSINNGNIIKIKQISSSLYSAISNSILTIGGISDTYSITTKAVPIISSGGGSSGGGGSSSYPTCIDTQLVCRSVAGSESLFKWYKKDGFTCTGGNLGNECELKTKIKIQKLVSAKFLEKRLSIKTPILKKIFDLKNISLKNIDTDLSDLSYLGNDMNDLRYNYRNDYNNWINSIEKVEEYLLNKNKILIKEEFSTFLKIFNNLKKYKNIGNINSINVDGTYIKYLEYNHSTIKRIQNLLFKKIEKKKANTYIYRLANKVTHNLNILLTDETLAKDSIKILREETISLYKDFIQEYSKLPKKSQIKKETIEEKIRRLNADRLSK